MNNHVTQLFIDLNAVDHNLNYFKNRIGSATKVLAVVKAFGYGSDAIAIAKHLENKVDYLAVAYIHEGIALRASGITTPILVLHPQLSNLKLLAKHKLEPNLYSSRILKAFIEIAKTQKLNQYPIHLKFNTGLNRLGFSIDDIEFIREKLNNNKHLKITSLFSHLVASEDENERAFSLKQIEEFNLICEKFKSNFNSLPDLHMSNTSGIINYPEAHYNMVRIGIGLFGFGNTKSVTSELKNVVSLKSIISQIHSIQKGETIGYNRGFKATESMKTATIPIGHADGINRSLGNENGYVSINGKKAPIVGNVCMDMIMVNVTEIDCMEGDEVIIFDNQKTVEELARNSNTISYEILTAISQRIHRTII